MSEDSPKGRISRRDFVRTGATAGLGATAVAGIPGRGLDERGSQDWGYSADVVIAGAGTSMGDEVVPRSFDPLHLADGPAKKRRSMWERLIPEVYRSV